MVGDHPKKSLSEILEQLIKNREESGSYIIPILHLHIEESTRTIVKERAPDALSLLDELIDKLEREFYNSKSNSELKPYGRPFASHILLSIEKYVRTYINPTDTEYIEKVDRLKGGLKYLLRGDALNDVYETFIAILKGEFENPYLSIKERYKRYYNHLHRDDYTLNFSYLSFEEQLSRIRERQARDYIHMGIEVLMHSPYLGMVTIKNRLESYLLGIY